MHRALGTVGRGLAVFLAVCALVGCSFERKSANSPITIEAAIFEGGYGLDWHRNVARNYEKLHPNIRVNLWGDPRVDEKIKPRLLRGAPPDLASCSLPVWKLIVANKLYPLNETLDSPAYGQNLSWRDSLVKGILSDFVYEGKTYALPSNRGAWLCWYDKRLFREHGWTAPKTWGEFMTLCEKIEQAKIAPLAFQGKYPIYAWYTLLSLYQRLAPFKDWYALQDLQPNTFRDPAFVEAARLLQNMATKHFQRGANAMTHTESQMEWVNGRAALVFCGLWLKNEMKDALPKGFEMACFPVPPVEGGKGDLRAIYSGGAENFFVFSQAKHPKEGADFLKYMLSMESARAYTERLDTLSPVRNSYKGVKISPALENAVSIMENSTRSFSDRLTGLYLELRNNALPDSLRALLGGEITPEAFSERLEAAAEKTRKNPEIYKPAARGVPAQ